MQHAALAAAGLTVRYEALHVEPAELARVLGELVATRAAGNVTIPHKEAVAARCGWLTPTARRAGAVNTFWVRDGTLCGDNTDVGGFDALARSVLPAPPAGLRVALIGAGGAAAAVLVATEAWPDAAAFVHARTLERAERLTRRLGIGRVAATVREAVDRADLVINATPLGLRPSDALPVDPSWLAPQAVAIDLVYGGGETPWVRAVRATGRLATDGTGMLVEQGALAFRRWFGVEPDRGAMWRALR